MLTDVQRLELPRSAPGRRGHIRARQYVVVGLLCLAVMHATVSSLQAQTPDWPIPIHRGNGLANVFSKLNSGQNVRIVFIGGSVTEMWGYRDIVTSWFSSHYPGKITAINAGWSGTGSLIGALRYAQDVVSQQPDLVFIEFAVNDLPEDPLLFVERNCDGMVRQSWLDDPMTDICFIETLAWYNYQPYLDGYLPTPVEAHYNVCDHYGIPSINVGWAMYEVIMAGTSWESLTINGDRVHPNAAGSQIYADAITSYLESERTRGAAASEHAIPSSLTDYPVTAAEVHELAAISPLPAGWSAAYNQFGTTSLVQSSTAGAELTVTFTGTAAALKMVMGPDDGTFSYSIDGGAFQSAGLVDAGHYFVWSIPVAKMLSTGTHTITIRVDSSIVRLVELSSAQSASTAEPAGSNLALTAVVSMADSEYGSGFTAAQAHDGELSTKWTSTNATQQHWLALDLGQISDVTGFIVHHVGAAGEWSEYNTEAFTIESAPDLAGPWSVEFTGLNTYQLNKTVFSFDQPNQLRYIRLNISDPGVDQYARIPEFEIRGEIPPPVGDLDLDGDVDQADFGLLQVCYTGISGHAAPGCELARLDDDDDVDSDDYARFLACMTGAEIPADQDCGR